MEIQVTMWLIFIAVFLIGSGVGYLCAKYFSNHYRQTQNLEAELKRNHTLYQEQKTQIDEHFAQTAELIHNMTASYQAVFDHLAAGADAFCSENSNKRRLFLQQESKVLSFDKLHTTNSTPDLQVKQKVLDTTTNATMHADDTLIQPTEQPKIHKSYTAL
jgi:uncharacterized protein